MSDGRDLDLDEEVLGRARSASIGSAEGDLSPVDAAVLSSVIEAYYPDTVRAGASARTRAQAAQAVCTVLAAGAVAALGATGGGDSLLTKAAGAFAAVLWLATAYLYLRSIGAPPKFDDRVGSAHTPRQLVVEVLSRAKKDREAIDARTRAAHRGAGFSLIVTVLVVVAALITGQQVKKMPVALVLSAAQQELLISECAYRKATVPGLLEVKASGEAIFRVDSASCGGRDPQFFIQAADRENLILK